MISKLADLLNNFFDEPKKNNQEAFSAELAVCILLVEIMRADHDHTDEESTVIKTILVDKFKLSDEEVAAVLIQAKKHAETATDLYQFTRRINELYSIEQRIELLDLMWQVAFADGTLDTHEEHIIRRIADLLHVRHSEYIQTKLNASK